MKNFTKKIAFTIILSLSLLSCSENDENEAIISISTINKISEQMNASITFDSSVTESNAIVINSEKEYRDFIFKIQNNSESMNGIGLQPKSILKIKNNSNLKNSYNPCPDGVYSGSGLTSGFATLNFDVSVTNGCISEIDGYFTGWTLGTSYTQGGTNFDCIDGRVCGTVNYNLFFQGLGTIYSKRVCYDIRLNC